VIELSFVALVALLIASNIYWALVCLKLTNRLMSRNYTEFMQSSAKPRVIKPQAIDMSDPVAERNAKDMNAMIGII
jgi:hypothetical protein